MKEVTTYLGKGGGGAYKYPGDIRYFLQNEKDPEMAKPIAPPKDEDTGEYLDGTDKLIWTKMVDDYVKRKNALLTNKEQAYSLIWGQATDVIKAKLEACNDYEKMNNENNLSLLLKI